MLRRQNPLFLSNRMIDFWTKSNFGLYIPKLIWRKLENFSTNSLALIVASNIYDESEYIRDFDEFLKEAK